MWRLRPNLTYLLLALYASSVSLFEPLHLWLAHGHSSDGSGCCTSHSIHAEAEDCCLSSSCVDQNGHQSDHDSHVDHQHDRSGHAETSLAPRELPLEPSCDSCWSNPSTGRQDCDDCRFCQLLNQAYRQTRTQLSLRIEPQSEATFCFDLKLDFIEPSLFAQPRAPPTPAQA